jgi:hypothetical protein
MVLKAIRELEGALELSPGEPHCVSLLARLRETLN